jgi:hypothetical protein
MYHFICPGCGHREISGERSESLLHEARSCHHCGFGFVFELLDDYYPAPEAAFVVCDQAGELLALGRGSRELTGLGEEQAIGRPVRDVLGLAFEDDRDHLQTTVEWGVRQLDKPVRISPEGHPPARATADLFPGLDEETGVLIVLTPRHHSASEAAADTPPAL